MPTSKSPSPELDPEDVRHARRILRALKRAYPQAICGLDFQDAYQLTVATVLSAQCTDRRVNQVTPALFAAYPDADSLAEAELSHVEDLIRSTNYYRNKAKNLVAMAQQVVRDHGGQIPKSLDSLITLPGIGRKTANVILGNAFGITSGIVVDTHVKRLSYRLGLTDQSDPVKVERDLVARLPRSEWIDFSHRLIEHGRRLCKSQRPLCADCSLREICPREGVEASSLA